MNNQELLRRTICVVRAVNCRTSSRSGHTYYGKQNYQCLLCARQFVIKNETVSPEKRHLVKRMLLERISLRGICRVWEVSLSWLLNFVEHFIQRRRTKKIVDFWRDLFAHRKSDRTRKSIFKEIISLRNFKQHLPNCAALRRQISELTNQCR